MIVKVFYEFDHMFSNLNINLNLGYLQNFLNLINKNESEKIETPSYILGQRCNYLKGKFALECQDYKTALIFFFKCREVKLISDAKIVKSAHKKINKILLITQETLKFGSSELFSEKVMKEKIGKMHNLVEQKLINFKGKLIPGVNFKRDYLILVDYSKTMRFESGKKLKFTKQQIFYIFDNIIKIPDRFALFLYNKTFNPLVNLNFKNQISNEYIKSLIDTITEDKDVNEDYIDSNTNNLFKAIKKSYNYLVKKCKFNNF